MPKLSFSLLGKTEKAQSVGIKNLKRSGKRTWEFNQADRFLLNRTGKSFQTCESILNAIIIIQ